MHIQDLCGCGVGVKGLNADSSGPIVTRRRCLKSLLGLLIGLLGLLIGLLMYLRCLIGLLGLLLVDLWGWLLCLQLNFLLLELRLLLLMLLLLLLLLAPGGQRERVYVVIAPETIAAQTEVHRGISTHRSQT